jgi:hypothetical protein
MTTFSDAAGSMATGSACIEANLAGGRAACLSLALEAIQIDAGVDGGGCQSNADCSPPLKVCQMTRHQCVQCASAADCPPGQQCTTSGACGQSCDPMGRCPGGETCCEQICVDTRVDPLNCGGCGMACTGGATLCCNSVCANASTSVEHCGGCGNACSTLNGTPTCSAGACSWTCNSGFLHCQSGNTGCETPSTTVDNCTGCGAACTPTNATTNMCIATGCMYTCQTGFLDCVKIGANTDGCETSSTSVTNCGGCGNACDTKNSTGASCSDGNCVYASPCPSPRADCSQANHNLDGCECPTPICCSGACQPEHTNGLGDNYVLDCQALGTPGNALTYTQAMANAAAAAWSGATDPSPSPRSCPGNTCVERTSASECAIWCYTKSIAGYVVKLPLASCRCPTAGDTPWN